jgi:hypothetical protein
LGSAELHGHQGEGKGVERGGDGGAVGCSIRFTRAVKPSSVASAGWWLLHHLSDQLVEP